MKHTTIYVAVKAIEFLRDAVDNLRTTAVGDLVSVWLWVWGR